MQSSFLLKSDFRVHRIGHLLDNNRDAWLDLRRLAMECERQYPAIGSWLDTKVMRGLANGSRVGFVGYHQETPIASAVIKKGDETAKFCHLRINARFQSQSLGEAFFFLMTREILHSATTIHLTLPESLWSLQSGFFSSFGFSQAIRSLRKYRLGDDEFECSAPTSTVWRAVASKAEKLSGLFLPGGFEAENNLLLSIKPAYAEAILAGAKTVEVRRRFSTRWEGARVSLYASSPRSALVGETKISKIVCGTASEIWSQFGARLGCDEASLRSYLAGCDKAYALELSETKPYSKSVSTRELAQLGEAKLRAPQSYCHIAHDSQWRRATSIAAMLQGTTH